MTDKSEQMLAVAREMAHQLSCKLPEASEELFGWRVGFVCIKKDGVPIWTYFAAAGATKEP